MGFKQSREGLDSILFGDLPSSIQAQDVIELYGKEGCGKTQVLIHLIANCILPRTWEGVMLNGRGVGVVFVDTDYHFSMIRLVEVLEHRITSCTSRQGLHVTQTAREIKVLIKNCLSRMIVARCNCSVELLATVESLGDVFSNKPEICVLLIDSISAFYWLDKLNAETAHMNRRDINESLWPCSENIFEHTTL